MNSPQEPRPRPTRRGSVPIADISLFEKSALQNHTSAKLEFSSNDRFKNREAGHPLASCRPPSRQPRICTSADTVPYADNYLIGVKFVRRELGVDINLCLLSLFYFPSTLETLRTCRADLINCTFAFGTRAESPGAR